MRTAGHQEEIDRLVDTLLAQPELADEIKALLRQRTAPVIDLRQVAAEPPDATDPDEFWDNFPV